MGCDEPLIGYYSKHVSASGKRPLVFSRQEAFSPIPVPVRCGQCMGCRLADARFWAVRCMHEFRCSSESEFLTLTYDNEHLPPDGSLVRRDPQLFLKRLRKQYGQGIRFFGCGEYGERSARPHYHFLLFNYMSRDRVFYGYSPKSGKELFSSMAIRRLWPYGNNIIGDVDYDSCSYVAGYTTGKISGDRSDDHYMGRLREFSMMSRRPGLGAAWFEKYGGHAYELDSVIFKGREMKPPRYYDLKMEAIDSARMEEIKKERRRRVDRKDNTRARRHVKEEVLRLNLVKRDI